MSISLDWMLLYAISLWACVPAAWWLLTQAMGWE